ncbi:hypothetical protein PACILC2_57210 [Paenibacillus cisolokensis]|uniref:HTH cro/C1-type domain-containing protein n=1 Tax=Paenibacillus cisolokensis TaxID=1658519 RepID=A0ABQ4NFY2_9BACL|nr:helix-turn-helix transcriptional regulator [Paenibacillus cisolokensis]GIQ67153.1 hypothetical protein PACILC2_57210 [Paenibacillus cisolokensis]
MNEVTIWKLKRIENKIRQKDVADHLGISASYVSLYEDGKVPWDQELVRRYRQFIVNYKGADK